MYILIMLILALIYLGFAIWYCVSMFKIFSRKETKQKNAKHNRQYWEGYREGYEAGRQHAFFQKYTINEVREMVGLPPIDKVMKDIEAGKGLSPLKDDPKRYEPGLRKMHRF